MKVLRQSPFCVLVYSSVAPVDVYFIDRRENFQYIYSIIQLINGIYYPMCNSNQEDIWQFIFI